jgi:hypothetical protein
MHDVIALARSRRSRKLRATVVIAQSRHQRGRAGTAALPGIAAASLVSVGVVAFDDHQQQAAAGGALLLGQQKQSPATPNG